MLSLHSTKAGINVTTWYISRYTLVNFWLRISGPESFSINSQWNYMRVFWCETSDHSSRHYVAFFWTKCVSEFFGQNRYFFRPFTDFFKDFTAKNPQHDMLSKKTRRSGMENGLKFYTKKTACNFIANWWRTTPGRKNFFVPFWHLNSPGWKSSGCSETKILEAKYCSL